MWRPIGTRASVRRDLPGPSNAVVVVVLCICLRDSCSLGFVQVCNMFVLGLDLYIYESSSSVTVPNPGHRFGVTTHTTT